MCGTQNLQLGYSARSRQRKNDSTPRTVVLRKLDCVAPFLPTTWRAYVDVDEIGLRIVADAAPTQAERRHLQIREPAVPQAYVDRLSFHMEAVLGHAIALGREHGIGGGRAITRDDVERSGAAHSLVQSHKQIEQPDVDRMDVAGAEVAQQCSDVSKAVGDITAALLIGRRQALPGMKIEE